jgi:N utilization substance protein B
LVICKDFIRKCLNSDPNQRPTADDLNPNLKFVENALIQQLEDCSELRKLSEKRKVNWMGVESQEMFRKMYIQIMESETFFEFMKNGNEGFEEDKAFALQLFKIEVANSELLINFFEEKSIFWQDDIDLWEHLRDSWTRLTNQK